MQGTYSDPHLRRRTVLVVVVNNAADLRRAASEGWYRIPQRRAPRRIGADYLAFYQTGAFGKTPESQTVTFYAPIRRYQLLTRAELLPAEGDHPRAEDYYFRIEVGPLMRLDHPIPAAKLRRVSFIYTTYERLISAADVTDLYSQDDSFEQLWQALHANRLRPLANRLVGEWPADITLRTQGGYLGIRCVDDDGAAREVRAAQDTRIAPIPGRWTMLHLSSEQIRSDLPGCLRQIAALLMGLGGAIDTRPGPEVRL